MLKLKRKQVVLIILAVILGIWTLGFIGRIVALSYIKTKLSKGLALNSEFTLFIKNVNYSFWGLSVSGQNIVLRDKQEKLLFAERAVFKIKKMSLSIQKIPFIISVEFPQQGMAVIDGTASIQNKKINALVATCNVERFPLVSLKPLMKKYFSSAPLPRSGRAYMTSKISLKETKFHSSNELKLENFNFEDGGDLGRQLLNVPRNALFSFMKNSQGNFILHVNVNGDFSSNKFNWQEVIASAMSQAFTNAISNIEKPGQAILNQPSKIMDSIKDILP